MACQKYNNGAGGPNPALCGVWAYCCLLLAFGSPYSNLGQVEYVVTSYQGRQ